MNNKKLSARGWNDLQRKFNMTYAEAKEAEERANGVYDGDMNPMIIDAKVFDRLHVTKTKEDGSTKGE